MQEPTGLRDRLHQAVDRVVDEFFPGGSPLAVAATGTGWDIARQEEVNESWTFYWPRKAGVEDPEEYYRYAWYSISAGESAFRVRLAWTNVREAWGRVRDRAIVFLKVGAPESRTHYALTEFVETDVDGLYAATIPDPQQPRSMLYDLEKLPAHLRGADVRRLDDVFGSVADGPSLRLVLPKDAEDDMVRHGCWVGELRGRF
jgi:hypothetical protein